MAISVISQCNVDNAKVKSVSLLIWTTTPWSLVANKAVCYRGDAEYSLLEAGAAGVYLVVATEMLARYRTINLYLHIDIVTL